MIELNKNDKIIIIALQGIGNTLFLIPMIKALKNKYPYISISLLLRKNFIKEVINNPEYIDEYYILEDFNIKNLLRAFFLLLKLRFKKYKVSILAFPSNKYLFNLVAFFVGAKYRISHKYFKYNTRNLNFLNNIHIPLEHVHDYYQHCNLLKPFGINVNKKIVPELWGNFSSSFCRRWLSDNGIKKNDIIVGMHPGSSSQRAMKEKRWDAKNYIFLIKNIVENFKNIKLFVFLGPDEKDLYNILSELKIKNMFVISGLSLSDTICLINKTKYFISNDSGLMNIASALGKKVISISGGPTDPVRTYPYGKDNIILFSNRECFPCRGLHNLGARFSCIYEKRKCLLDINKENVWYIVKLMLKGKL